MTYGMVVQMSKCIFYILPYLSQPPFETIRYERIYRERQIILHTRKLKCKCDLLLPTFSLKATTLSDDCDSFLYPVDNPKTGDKFSYVSTRLLERIEKEKPDLVVFKGMGYRLSRWLVLNCKHKFRFAFMTAGGTKDILAPYADYILAETQQQIDENFQEQQTQGRVDILPKLNLPGSFQASEDKDYDIINVGGFTKNKNQESLIPLAKTYKVAMIGDGLLFDQIKNMIQPYKENVYMPGNLPREEIPSLIARSRLMVHSAHHEGLARVVMESFACGVPVVASRRAMPNAFEHGVHGLLVEPDEIIPAARKLLADEDALQKMGRNAYEYAKENCTEEAVFRVVQKMYDRVFNEPPFWESKTLDLKKIKTQSFQLNMLYWIKVFGKHLGIKKVYNHISKIRRH